jgi:hypothetical protein
MVKSFNNSFVIFEFFISLNKILLLFAFMNSKDLEIFFIIRSQILILCLNLIFLVLKLLLIKLVLRLQAKIKIFFVPVCFFTAAHRSESLIFFFHKNYFISCIQIQRSSQSRLLFNYLSYSFLLIIG